MTTPERPEAETAKDSVLRARLTVARRLLADGRSRRTVQLCTGLSDEQLNRLSPP